MTRKSRAYIYLSLGVLILFTGFYFWGPIRFANGRGPLNSFDTMPVQTDSAIITIAFTGDIMGHTPLIEAMYQPQTKTYDYTPIFKHVAPYFKRCDWVIGNLEVTLAGAPYTGYPTFSSPDALLNALLDAGYTTLITANNHSYDKGKNGFTRTLHVLDSMKMPHTGTFRDASERDSLYPLIWESQNGFRIALLNYTYGTNGIKVLPPNIVNMIDTSHIRKDLLKAKQQEVDFIITTFHWGLEYQRMESTQQALIAQFATDYGADLIIGAHPHVVQPIRWITPKSDSTHHIPVFYSLGNFISNQRDVYRDGGIIAEVVLVKKNNKVRIHSYQYIPTWVYKKESAPQNYTIIPVSMAEMYPTYFNLSSKDSVKLHRFGSDTRMLLHPISEKIPKWELMSE